MDPPPGITSCPSDQTVNLPPGSTSTAVIFPQAVATDTSGIPPTVSYSSNPPGVSFTPAGTSYVANNVPAGMTTVIVTATDNANNMATCTFTLNGMWSRQEITAAHNGFFCFVVVCFLFVLFCFVLCFVLFVWFLIQLDELSFIQK